MGYYCGIEGQLYLALHLVLAGGICAMALLGTAVLIPVYAYYGESEVNKQMNYISIAHIINEYEAMSIVLVFFVIYSIMLFAIISAYIRYVSHVHSRPSEISNTINKYTVEIHGIPHHIKPFQAENEILAVFTPKYNNDIHKIYVVPDL